MDTLRENLKVDCALCPTSIATTNVTGLYYNMKGYDKALFVLETGPIADTETATLAIMGNTVAGSSGAAAITSHEAVVEATVNAASAKVHVNSPDNDDTVTINDVTFTKKASKDDAENEFTTVAELVVQINAAGLGITASVIDTDYALLLSTDPGAVVITVTSTDAAKLVPSVVTGIAYVEVPEGAKRWVAAKVTTTATIICSVTLIRGQARQLPVAQAVGEGYPS